MVNVVKNPVAIHRGQSFQVYRAVHLSHPTDIQDHHHRQEPEKCFGLEAINQPWTSTLVLQ